MTQATELFATPVTTTLSEGLARRSAVLAYGVISYGVGVISLLWFILAVGGLAPVGFAPLQTASWPAALAVNAALIMVFGLQHSIMARAGFKRRLQRWLPAAAERATFLLATGVVLLAAIALWQPLPGTVWNIQGGTGEILLWTLYALGWGYLFAATFVTNHFELMGLRQVYLYFRNIPYKPLPFVRKYMYRYSRHPMMLGMLAGMWATPVMSVTQCAMATLLTLYIAVGVYFEERDLVRNFGEAYRAYRKEIAALIPKVF